MMKPHRMTVSALCASMLVLGLPQLTAVAQDEPEAVWSCPAAPKPVTSLAIGSRYQANSETRSEIAEDANDAVNAALKPVEDFINEISSLANAAALGEPQAQAKADCVLDWLESWADADALSELDSLNAWLAISPRLSGLALSYLQARDVASVDPGRSHAIQAWLQQRAEAVVEFFETEAGPLASRNNLRAWASLATAAIGSITADEELQTWAQESYRGLVCGADPNGALPAEMERGPRALHYQLHAIAPLVVAIQFIDPAGEADAELCRDSLNRIAEFALAGVKDPNMVAELVGADQVFSGDDETELSSYQLAWAEPYLARYNNPELELYIQPMRPLGYSKLGGDLTALYAQGSPFRYDRRHPPSDSGAVVTGSVSLNN